MKFFLTLIFTAVTVFSANPSNKTGWIDMQKALTSVKEGKRILSKLEKEVETNKKELEKEQVDLQGLKSDFEKRSLVWNEKKKRDKQLEIQTRFLKLQEKYAKYQQDIKMKQNKASQEIVAKITDIVKSFAAKNDYSYVYEKNALIYKPDGDDITSKIIKLYNKKHK